MADKKRSVAAGFFTQPQTEDKVSNVKNMKLTTVDDLFSTEESRQAGNELSSTSSFQKVTELLLNELFDFEGHVFKVRDDNEMKELVQSVTEYGVRQPIQVRPRANGGYEILAGHRRTEASRRAGKNSIPAIIENVDDEMATIIMVDTNLGQRQNLLPSEKAFAYKARLEAMKRQGARTDLTSAQVGRKSDGKESRELLAEQVGESRNQISRYIRLTELIPELLNAVDEDRLKFNPAVVISYLNPSQQKDLWEYMDREQVAPSLEQAGKLKEASEKGDWNLTLLDIYMTPTRQVSNKVVLKIEALNAYWQKKTPKQIEEEITIYADAIAKLRQYTTIFPENISNQEFEHRLIHLVDTAFKQRLERPIL